MKVYKVTVTRKADVIVVATEEDSEEDIVAAAEVGFDEDIKVAGAPEPDFSICELKSEKDIPGDYVGCLPWPTNTVDLDEIENKPVEEFLDAT